VVGFGHARRMRGWWGGVTASVLVLLVGLAAAVASAVALDARQRTTADSLMERRAALAVAAVSTEVHRYLDTLRQVAAAAGTHEDLTLSTFMAVTAPLAEAKLVGATGVSFVVPAGDDEVAATQRYWRQQGATDLVLKPEGTGREHLFGIFRRALDGVTVEMGGDGTRSREGAEAMAEARRSGAPAVSETYVLLRDRALPAGQQQLSFVLTTGVYTPVGGDGRREFLGWVVISMRGQDFLGGALAHATQGVIDAALWAGRAGGAWVRVAGLQRHDDPDLHREAVIAVANREWILRTAARSTDLPGGHSILPIAVGVGGGALAVAVAALVLILATGRARARAQVAAATAELRATELEARRQASLLAAVINTIDDGVGVADEHGHLLVHNPAAARTLGIRSGGTSPDLWQEHYDIRRTDGTPYPQEELPLVRAIAGEEVQDELLVHNPERADEVVISVTARPLDPSGGQAGAVAVFHDITAIRRQEADLTAFAGIVAHDLKSPLAAIAGHAEVLADEIDELLPGDDGNLARRSLDRVTAGVTRMRLLIDDLLAYTTARDADLALETVDLRAVADEVVAERTDHLRGGDDAFPDIYVGALPPVTADPTMIRQLLDNLVGNALKYVRPGQPARVDISATGGDGWVRVDVADRGIGIADEDKPYVFNTFRRAHRYSGYAGTGLGLAICKRVVERHGGTLAIGDNPGGGTRLSFTLPVARTDATALPGAAATHPVRTPA